MTIYNREHIVIQKILGRKFNNPLGTAPLKIIEAFYRHNRKPLNVIDIGCGRGASICWLARRIRGKFVGIDPSPFMLEEAKKTVAKTHLEKKVILRGRTVFDMPAVKNFDFALLMDVLSWVKTKTSFLNKLTTFIKQTGFLFISDYFCSSKAAAVRRICNLWNIDTPPDIANAVHTFYRFGLRPVYLIDSTAMYLKHWQFILGKTKQKSHLITREVSREAYIITKERAASIINAVKSGGFGHYFAIMTDNGNKNAGEFLRLSNLL